MIVVAERDETEGLQDPSVAARTGISISAMPRTGPDWV